MNNMKEKIKWIEIEWMLYYLPSGDCKRDLCGGLEGRNSEKCAYN